MSAFLAEGRVISEKVLSSLNTPTVTLTYREAFQNSV